MPRGPRVDILDGLYHVIARGVERRDIFRTDRDRDDFLNRLATVVEEEGLRLFAFVLMGNHFHLVVRRAGSSLGHCIKRLLTGYSVAFNLRHRRTGHLFANRYKAVLCEDDLYLLQLVRYVHLNPVRARLVRDPADYPWSGHLPYLRPRRAPSWLDTATVLDMLGGSAAYRRFIIDGLAEGERRELCGREGPDGDTSGNGGDAATLRCLWLGGQILGTERFARGAITGSRREELEREMRNAAATDLPSLAQQVARDLELHPDRLHGSFRDRRAAAGRRELVRRAVFEKEVKPVEIARYLGIRPASVTGHLRVLRRGRNAGS